MRRCGLCTDPQTTLYWQCDNLLNVCEQDQCLDAISPKFRMSMCRTQQLNYLHQGKKAPIWAWTCLLVQGRHPFLVGHIWSTFFFSWVCNQFSSFCLGRDWNPSSSNFSVNLRESRMGSTMAVGHPNQLPTRPPLCLASHATRQMDFNSVDDFLLGLSQQCPWAGKQQWQVLWGDPCSVPIGVYLLLIALMLLQSYPKVNAQTPPWDDPFPSTSVTFPKDKMIIMTFNHVWLGPNSNQ